MLNSFSILHVNIEWHIPDLTATGVACGAGYTHYSSHAE